jgi:two-component system sensor histidine kinase YesM
MKKEAVCKQGGREMKPGARIQYALNTLYRKLDDFSLKKKLFLMYIVCVILPVTLLDGLLLTTLLNMEARRQEDEMQDVSNAVKYTLSQKFDDAIFITNEFWMNSTVNDFLNTQFASPHDFYARYWEIRSNSLVDVSTIARGATLHFYADNDTIITGGEIGNYTSIQNQKWFKDFLDTGLLLKISAYISDRDEQGNRRNPVRAISIIRKMNWLPGCDKLMKLDLDYSGIENAILNADFNYDVFVCSGDTILFSNRGNTSKDKPFDTLTQKEQENIGNKQSIQLYFDQYDIYVLKKDLSIMQVVQNNAMLITITIAFSLLVPIAFMYLINRSFTYRLTKLSKHLAKVGRNEGHIEKISNIRGHDEIGELMHSYNRMAARINELIHVVYKRRLEEQAAHIARQRAELLALQSQINPHFLFNALESIRMHSVIRHEDETADMICKLSLMMRSSVEWSQDIITVAEEIRFTEAYLQLQKYRFGDQLSYRIHVDPACLNRSIPKLTVVTFVENACVHGIESKTSPGWVFVDVSCSKDEMILEVEDTGIGMSEAELKVMQENMNHASVERLRQKGSRIGVMNACVRLKSFSRNKCRFYVESEEGVGTTVSIHIPLKYVQGQKTEDMSRTVENSEKRRSN